MSKNLERLAKRVGTDPLFLAAPLKRYADSHHLDDNALAARLGCDLDTLTHLRLCRNPQPEAPHFWNGVQEISANFRLDADRLAEILRAGQGLLVLLPAPGVTAPEPKGYTMAAREAEEEPEGES